MSYLDWHAGMKVVCVDDVFWRSNGLYQGPMPRKGGVYAVKSIEAHDAGSVLDGYLLKRDLVCLILSEFGGRVAFEACHFRPVQPRKTDISIFEAMLNDAPMQLELS